jgi:hypothetical protein
VLGITKLENEDELIKKLLEKYKGEVEIEDITYEDISDEPDGNQTNLFQ